jgi:hypothetical protein
MMAHVARVRATHVRVTCDDCRRQAEFLAGRMADVDVRVAALVVALTEEAALKAAATNDLLVQQVRAERERIT